jgi:hypothetical protein
LVVTETSIEGSVEVRSAWVRDSTAAVNGLVRDGLDIRGYTWWPLFDFVDWSWASGGRNVEEFIVERAGDGGEVQLGASPPLGDPAAGKSAFLRRMGLVRLDEQPDGTLARIPTDAAAAFTHATVVAHRVTDQAGPHVDAPM